MLRFLPTLVPLCAVLSTGLLAAPILDVDPSSVVLTPAEEPVPDTPKPAETTMPVALTAVAPPFTGVITATTANVRGGPSANHYPLARLTRGTEVKVLKRSFAWYQIAPPAGVFCWVHKDLARVEADGKTGTITSRNVNIRGDSILGHTPIKSDVVDQVGTGTRVTVVGRDGDFLRIEPTAGVKVYVHADLVAPKGGEVVAERTEPSVAGPRPRQDLVVSAFGKAEEALKAERLKPPAEWDLDTLTALYKAVLEKATTARAKAVVTSRLQYVERLTRLKATLATVERGRQETEQALKAIEARRAADEAARAADRRAKRDYTVTGILKTLVLSDGRPRFKLVHSDDPNRILCVVEGDVAALKPLVDRRVGIDGRFKVTDRWPVRLLQVASVEALETGDDTRIARPPARTD